jgi:hypothetical protein
LKEVQQMLDLLFLSVGRLGEFLFAITYVVLQIAHIIRLELLPLGQEMAILVAFTCSCVAPIYIMYKSLRNFSKSRFFLLIVVVLGILKLVFYTGLYNAEQLRLILDLESNTDVREPFLLMLCTIFMLDPLLQLFSLQHPKRD